MTVLKNMIPEAFQGNSPTSYHIIWPTAIPKGQDNVLAE